MDSDWRNTPQEIVINNRSIAVALIFVVRLGLALKGDDKRQ